MTEPESHTLAWMRRLDEKFDALQTDVTEIKQRLGAIEDELLVLNGIVVRLEGREIEATGLKRLYDRNQRRLEDHERRLALLEGRQSGED